MIANLFKKVKNDATYRIKSFLFLSLAFNLVYSLFLFIVSQLYFSKWFFVMAVYYGLLTIARIFMYLQTDTKKVLLNKIVAMRTCGVFLILINLVVSVMMFVLIYTSKQVKHHEITVITIATYTFSALTIAILGSVKHFKRGDYVFTCIKMVSMVSASVSMVTLTNTMLATWGEENVLLRSIVLPILSGAVAIIIIACAVFMIVKANIDLRTLKNEEK